MSKRDPRYLELSNGDTYVPVGPNICWPRFETDEREVFALYERYFRSLSANGGNFTRVWLSHPFFEVEWRKAGEYDETKAKRIDALLTLAAKYDIRVKLCIHHFRSLDAPPPRFPGSVSMGNSVYSKASGGPFADITEFFRSDAGKRLFLQKLDYFAGRYRQEPAILGWELWNEINAVQGEGWRDWTAEMLPELKRRLSNHLALQSLGSFDREPQRTLYRQFSAMKGNECAQVHRYLDPGASLDVCRGPMDLLARDAVRELIDYRAGKPVILSEVGAVEANHAGPSKLYGKDREGVLLHDLLFAPFFSGSAAPGQSWHWHFYIDKNDLWWHYGRFTEAVRGLNPILDAVEPFEWKHPRLRILGLRGKSGTWLWCRDSASTWQSELLAGKPAELLSGERLSPPEDAIANRNAAVEFYDPWQNSRSEGSVQKGVIPLPEFRRSLIVRIR